jgi:hypothetical protein
LLSGLPTKIMRTSWPVHLILLDLMDLILFAKVYNLLSSSCSFHHPPTISSLFDPNILHSTQFSDILSLCSSFDIPDQVSHPHKTTGKIIALCLYAFRQQRRRQFIPTDILIFYSFLHDLYVSYTRHFKYLGEKVVLFTP